MSSSTIRGVSSAAQRRLASTLIVADHDGSAVGASTLSTVTAAGSLGDITVLVVGGSEAAAKSAASVVGVNKVLHAETSSYIGGEVRQRCEVGGEVGVMMTVKANLTLAY